MQDGAAPGMVHEQDPDGIVRITFDQPGSNANLLSREILEALDRLLDELSRREGVRGLLFESAKPGMFLAGMDVEAIAAIKDAYEAGEGARRGQAVFQRIADAPWPTACAIGGACLGGGSELALACAFRVAADDPAVRIGFPEVRLGIVPGFGGTQRLPRLVGLVHALDLILTGRQIGARRAERIGLVDRIVPPLRLRREALAMLRGAAERGRHGAARRGRPLAARLVESAGPLRRRLLADTRRKTAKRFSPADYPAPFRALDAIEAAFAVPLSQGLDLEARIVGELAPTRTSKNLIWLFTQRNALKKDVGGYQATPRRIRKVAVLGSGVMGAGIAGLVAQREIPVRLRDVREESLLRGLKSALRDAREAAAQEGNGPGRAERAIGFIAPTLGLEGLARADLVIEAVVEDLSVKQAVLAEAEERIGERAVFASNTSTLPITEIAARAVHPERVVGLHFFNPAHRMPLVEVVAGHRTSPEAVATVHAFALELGKTPVVVRDSPGFLVNRILMAHVSEAARLLGEGFGIDAIDCAMRAFGMPAGPFELLDRIGLDTAKHASAVLEAAFGKRLGGAVALLDAMVADGRLGDKNGRGFHRYRGGVQAGADPKAAKLAGAPAPKELPGETLQERMVLAMVKEAVVCLEDGVAREPRDVDVAMILGTGFPAFRGGPLRYADAVGIPVLVDRLSRLADGQGERFRPAGLLREMVREERGFYPA
jgi:3-hydroxyacyl-CoA dehydrogenase / enoyl-CoA hydratase / 3-hydroxybutyryl-CoA epimerase